MAALRGSDVRSRIAASGLALLAAVSVWLSAGIVFGGDTVTRIAVLPSIWILVPLAVTTVAVAWFARLELEHAWPLAISVVVWLPFLPYQVPGSFLVWDGPIEAIVWLVVIAGLVAARPPAIPAALGNARIAPWLAAAAMAVSSLVVFSQVRNVIPGGDEPHYLAATQSLLHDADLKVANNYESGEYLEYFPGRLEPHFLKRSTSGEIYSIHAPGVSVIVLPAFAIAGYRGAVVTMILFAALSAALAWRLAFAISNSLTGAWIGVAAVFASAPYFFHTFTIYPEVIGGFCVLAGVWLLLQLADERDVSARALVAVGALLAILPWLHSRFAVLAGISGLLIAARLAARPPALKRILAFLSVPAVLGAVWFAFFYLIWGSPNPAAPYGPDTGTSATYIPRGVIGLLFDQQFGVMVTAPIYVMAAIGGVALMRARPRLAIELALIVIPYAAAVASYAMWWGGAAAPARFLVAVLPLAVLPVAYGSAGSRTFRAVALVLAVVSAALLLPRAFEEDGRFLFNNRGGVDATIEWLTRSVDLSLALPSVHRDGGTAAVRDGLIWLVVFGATVLLGGLAVRTHSTAARFAAAALATALAVVVASTIVWSLRGQSVIAPERARLATLAAYRPAWHQAPADFLGRLTIDVNMARLSRLPAGEYRLSRGEPWQVLVGRNDQPIAFAGDRLRLPVMLQSPTLLARGLTLTPIAVTRPVVNRNATHAAQYADRRVYAFDERAYLERDGFWMRANGTTDVVIETGDGSGGLPISITAGAVPTTIELSVGSWERSFSLTAGERQEVVLPPAPSGVWPLRLRAGAGFRPSERDPGNRDVRLLSAWVALLR
jgi:hypothetical protein